MTSRKNRELNLTRRHQSKSLLGSCADGHQLALSSSRVVGMLSIGEPVKAVIQDQTEQIEQLERYIAG
jgi:hypothetical protein